MQLSRKASMHLYGVVAGYNNAAGFGRNGDKGQGLPGANCMQFGIIRN